MRFEIACKKNASTDLVSTPLQLLLKITPQQLSEATKYILKCLAEDKGGADVDIWRPLLFKRSEAHQRSLSIRRA